MLIKLLETAIDLQQAGRLDDAEKLYLQVLSKEPNNHFANHLLGVIQHQRGRNDEAIVLIAKAVQANPADAETHKNLGNAQRAAGMLDDARQSYLKALELKPDYAEACNNLGLALTEAGMLPEAIEYCLRATQINPEYADGFVSLGNAYRLSGNLEDSRQALLTAFNINPNSPHANNSIGVLHKDMELHADALGFFRKAILLDPGFAEAHMNLGMTLLMFGEMQEGWREFSWRSSRLSFPQPEWDGAPLAGKTILLYAEQGLGDSIQFIRYVPMIKELGGHVVVECQGPLQVLFSGIKEIDTLIVQGAPRPDFDVHASLYDLPGIMGTSVDSVPVNIPYLTTDGLERPIKIEPHANLDIGIVWAGSPKNVNDRNRSCEISDFKKLVSTDDFRFHSLQVGPRSADLEEACLADRVNDLGSYLSALPTPMNVLPTLVEQMDLVISVDTSCAHLAGALGVPVWMPLSRIHDFRWMADITETPWYPGMRLYRQQSLGDWEGVLATISSELEMLKT